MGLVLVRCGGGGDEECGVDKAGELNGVKDHRLGSKFPRFVDAESLAVSFAVVGVTSGDWSTSGSRLTRRSEVAFAGFPVSEKVAFPFFSSMSCSPEDEPCNVGSGESLRRDHRRLIPECRMRLMRTTTNVTLKMTAITIPMATRGMGCTLRLCKNAINRPVQTSRMMAKNDENTSAPRVVCGRSTSTETRTVNSTIMRRMICARPLACPKEMKIALKSMAAKGMRK